MIKLFKFLTVVFFLQLSVFAKSEVNPVFEKLKQDMWVMGLEFDYSGYEHMVIPSNVPTDSEFEQPEELTSALNM